MASSPVARPRDECLYGRPLQLTYASVGLWTGCIKRSQGAAPAPPALGRHALGVQQREHQS